MDISDLEVPWVWGGNIWETEIKFMMEKCTDTPEPSSLKLMNSRPTTVDTPGKELGPLCVGNKNLIFLIIYIHLARFIAK